MLDADTEADRIRSLGETLAGRAVSAVFPARAGGNNRVFQIRCGADDFALKLYPSVDIDPRNRLGAEFAALRFLEGQTVPRAVAADASVPCALYEWVDGESVAMPGPFETDALAAFLAALRDLPGGEGIAVASAAGLSSRALLTQIAERRARLDGIAGVSEFLGTTFDPLRAALERSAEGIDSEAFLPRSLRVLSPSDFGFHNALRRRDGTIVFVDFEYFGWDDPAKMMADAMLHPGNRLSPAMRRRLFAALGPGFQQRDPGFNRRFRVCLRLCALIWCLIMLNVFLSPSGIAAHGRDRLEKVRVFADWIEQRFRRDIHER